jgi:multidrug resistance efflux pump
MQRTDAAIPAGHDNSTATESNRSQVAYLNQALWKQFGDASTFEAFADAWLTLQCSIVEEVLHGVVVLAEPGSKTLAPVAYWPPDSSGTRGLMLVAEAAIAEKRGVVRGYSESAETGGAKEQHCEIAFPVSVDGQVRGVIALVVDAQSDSELRMLLRRLQWGSGWLEALLRRHAQTDAGAECLRLILQLTAVCLEYRQFPAAATALATGLASHLNCDRVSLGFRLGKHTHIVAMSHSADVGAGSNLLRAIGFAMDEALDQFGRIIYPPGRPNTTVISRAHRDLASLGGVETVVCTVPLTNIDELIGAITYERFKGPAFDRDTVALLEHIAGIAGPILEIKRRDDQPLVKKAVKSFRGQLEKLIGPRHYGFKLIAAGLLGLVLFFSFATAHYRVAGDATLEGIVQRVIAAPIEGYIAEARVRPGDIVRQGELVLKIDDRDLRLQYLRWSGQKEQVRGQYRDALAQHDRSRLNILQAQLDQADAQLELLNEQISRTGIVAPFDGVIVKGDLSQELGAPVQRGEVLMEIAPLNAYRVVLQIDERDISGLQTGQRGELILSSLPHMRFNIEVTSITPVSVAEQGRNTFRVEGQLEQGADILRPGMKGTAKIAIDERKLIWIWTHRFTDWLRLWLWSGW